MSIACKDHKGKKFSTVSDMCRYWKVSVSLYNHRIRRGFTTEQALTGVGIRHVPCVCKDHEGNEFGSVTEMCSFWGVKRTTYRERIKANFSVSQALSSKAYDLVEYRYTDHKGNKFKTASEMYQHWGTHRGAFKKKQGLGLSLECCLTDKWVDHKGAEFESLTAMCSHWCVPKYTFLRRLSKYGSIEKALLSD